MIYLQNPTIPNPTDPIEIDRAIQDLQIKLANSLVWLSHAYPRAYPQIEATQSARTPFVFPSVYLGKANNDYKYTNVAPDNDKTAQCFFLVDTETINDFVRGEHNVLSYRVSIIFTANLKLVNDIQLATEIFQANLIQQVREVLTREITLTPYDLSIVEVSLLFRDVYREFQLQNAAVLEKAPFTHFRFECDITLQEECNLPVLNRCDALKNNIQGEDDLICLLSLYDFSQTTIQNALTPTQISDLQAAFCTAVTKPQYSMLFDGLNEGINCYNIAACNFTNLQPFTITSWVKSANYGGSFQGIVTKRSGAAGGTGWTFFFLNGDLYCLLQNGINYINMRTQGVTFTNNTFYHLALTVSGSGTAAGIKFYANGLQLPTFTIQDNLNASISNTAAVMIGNEEALAMPFNGNIGYSRVFNIEFSPAQVVTDYSGNGGKMWEESPEIANQVFGWKAGQSALFGTPLAAYWFFPNELDDMQLAPFSNNMEITDKTTDVPV